MLFIRPTGGGKPMVYQVASILTNGVTLFISPLLALGSDQTHKLMSKTRTMSHVCSFHMDEMQLSSVELVAKALAVMRNPDSKGLVSFSVLSSAV